MQMEMKNYYSDVIQFTGSHYDFGYMQGELLKESPILYNRQHQWKTKRRRHFTVNKQEAIALFSRFIPRILDELQGLADALSWSLEAALREFGGYYVDYAESGCSIFTGKDFMVRNYDSHPGFYEGRYVLFQPTDGGYATIGPSMQITGRTDGMNEHGLAMGYNFINRVGSGDGFLCNMIGRMILETCKTVDEAVALLEAIPHRTTFSYVVSDSSGVTYVIEASPRKVISREANISTNHFEVLLDENRFRTDDSKRRSRVLARELPEGVEAFGAYQFMNDRTGEVFAKQYDASNGTIHTAAYLPQEGKALFAIGGNRMPVVFDFKRFLRGEREPITKIRGKLGYHTSFVNMEKLAAE